MQFAKSVRDVLTSSLTTKVSSQSGPSTIEWSHPILRKPGIIMLEVLDVPIQFSEECPSLKNEITILEVYAKAGVLAKDYLYFRMISLPVAGTV